MWLRLERGVARRLRRMHRVAISDPNSDQNERLSFVLQAAHTLLPEADVSDLPAIAREEVRAGLTGPLRRAMAATDEQSDDTSRLRDQVVEGLSGRSGLVGAITLADQVHLRRLVRGEVPPVVAVGCLQWYGHYRKSGAPNTQLVAPLLSLGEAWLRSPPDRPRLESAMHDEAVILVGTHPEDLIDIPV